MGCVWRGSERRSGKETRKVKKSGREVLMRQRRGEVSVLLPGESLWLYFIPLACAGSSLLHVAGFLSLFPCPLVLCGRAWERLSDLKGLTIGSAGPSSVSWFPVRQPR